MVDYSLLFTDFKNREEDLRKITRYQNYSVMFYRTNLFTHSKRVAWLVQEMIPFAQATWQDFNGQKAKFLALVHDDQEIIMGDIPAGNKSKK
jgi:5'-deoxynucleotidase YfbR-like HD superfamily hydrolase